MNECKPLAAGTDELLDELVPRVFGPPDGGEGSASGSGGGGSAAGGRGGGGGADGGGGGGGEGGGGSGGGIWPEVSRVLPPVVSPALMLLAMA